MTVAAVSLAAYGADAPASALHDASTLYRAVYAEPPYLEGEADFRDFANSLPHRASAPSFRLVLAQDDTATAVGFAMGHDLAPNTKWWDGALSTLPTTVTTERVGRTFAVIELAVISSYRRQGLAGALHEQLLHGLAEERVTLLVRPDAVAAHAAYESWGYSTVGQIRPFAGAPVYDAMIRPLSQD